MARKSKYGAPVAVAIGAAVAAALAVIFIGAAFNTTETTTPRRPADALNLGPETVDGSGAQPTAHPQNADHQSADVQTADADINYTSEALTFETHLPPHQPGDPVIASLRRDAQRYLDRIRPNAEANMVEAKAGRAPPWPWSVSILWRETARAEGIVSLIGEAEEFTGGAHPNTMLDTHIARIRTGDTLTFADMIQPNRQSSPAFQIAVCEALKAAKAEGLGSATIFDEPIVCAGPKSNIQLENAVIALAPSDKAGRFGGAYVLYAPYIVGAYVEGPFRLTVQQSVFAEDLRPEYRALFDGTAPALEN